MDWTGHNSKTCPRSHDTRQVRRPIRARGRGRVGAECKAAGNPGSACNERSCQYNGARSFPIRCRPSSVVQPHPKDAFYQKPRIRKPRVQEKTFPLLVERVIPETDRVKTLRLRPGPGRAGPAQRSGRVPDAPPASGRENLLPVSPPRLAGRGAHPVASCGGPGGTDPSGNLVGTLHDSRRHGGVHAGPPGGGSGPGKRGVNPPPCGAHRPPSRPRP